MSLWRERGSAPPLAANEVHLWRVPLELSAPRLTERQDLLSREERARMDRLRFDWLRARYAARRGGLRLILARYLGADPRALRFEHAPQGKPMLPALPDGRRLSFNLSDSEGTALLAVAWNATLGVDLEAMRPLPELARLARDYFAKRERDELFALPPAQWERAFFRIWTQKEAWLKGRGFGLSIDLASFTVTVRPNERRGSTWSKRIRPKRRGGRCEPSRCRPASSAHSQSRCRGHACVASPSSDAS
ncbi:MAG: 4'-phosphopantetheinyl transferase superfamily protein [Candidatus Eisenbacteria bacterium]